MMNMASGGMMGGAVNTAMSGQGVKSAQAYDPYANQAAQQLNQAQAVAAGAATGAKFCPNCGTPANGANFCSNCGTKLN